MPAIIDFHSHYMPPEIGANTAFFKAGWSDIDRHLSTMDSCGIERSVLLYPTSDAHIHMGGWRKVASVYNDKIAEVVRRYPDRFIGAAIIPGTESRYYQETLSRVSDGGFGCLSLASSYDGIYLDDNRFDEIFAFASENRLPVHVHAQIMKPIGEERVKDPLLSPVLEYVFDVTMCLGKMMMEGTFQKFPDVKFVFPHYGGVLPLVKDRFDNTYQMLRKRNFVKDLGQLPGAFFKNLYFDTSGSSSAAALQCALEVVDDSHILYGSDFPATQKMPETIQFLEKHPAASKILSGNARQLLEDQVGRR